MTATNSRYEPVKRKRLNTAQRMAVYEKCQGHCAYCGEPLPFKKMQVDHITPIELAHLARAEGNDVNHPDNLLPTCRPCNYIKSTLVLEKFRNMIAGWHDTLERDSTTYRNAVRFGVVEPKPHRITFYFEQIGYKAPDYAAAYHEMLRQARERAMEEEE